MSFSYNPKSWDYDRQLLKQAYGIDMPSVGGFVSEMPRVGDSVPLPITASNNGILSQYTNWIDPSVIETIVSPLKSEEIYGSRLIGNWAMKTATFTMTELAGDTQEYSDWEAGGHSTVNMNYEYRQNYLYQTNVIYGDLQQEQMDLTPVALVAYLQKARIRNLQVKQNRINFFGVENLQNYGSLNDPSLPAAITPSTKTAGGTLWKNATAMEVYNDVMDLYTQLQIQNQGVVNLDESLDMDAPLRLVVSNDVQPAFLKTNEYGISVTDLLKKNFPNLTQVSAPQLNLGADKGGNLVQLFRPEYEGNRTFECAFSSKMRSHGIVRKESSFSEKISQGGWGTILKYPTLVAQMIGV